MSTQPQQQDLIFTAGCNRLLLTLWVTIILLLFVCPCGLTGDVECGNFKLLEDGNGGRLTSPKFPEPYPSNLTCDWIVRVNGSLRLEFTILYFDSAPGDSLSVYQQYPEPGTIPLWSFGNHVVNDTQFSTNRTVWFQLISSGPASTSQRKFEIEFESVINTPSECPNISPPANGYMSSNNFTINSVITFACTPGFVLQGVGTIRCISSESADPIWSSDVVPTCSPPCLFKKDRLGVSDSFYEIPSNVNVVLSPDYPGNVVGPVSCAWQIVAPNGLTKIVISDTALIHPPFSLEIWRNRITDFLDPESTKYLVVNKTSFQEPFEYSIHGPAVSLILRTLFEGSSGRFSISVERSSVTKCGLPPLADKLVYFPHKTLYDIGDVITYSCQDTYVLTTSRNVSNVCMQLGHWSSNKLVSLPVCGADCRRWSPEQQTFIPVIISSLHGTLYSEGYPNPITPGLCRYTFEAGSQEIYTFDMVSSSLTNTQLTFYETIGSNTLATSWNSSQYISKVSTVILTSESELPTDSYIISFEKQHIDVKCNMPQLSNHLKMSNQSTRDDYEVESTVSFSCGPLFDITGSNETTCIFVNSTSAVWWPDIPICFGSCGGSLVSDNVTIFSPGYPYSYSKTQYTMCHWEIINSDKKPFEISVLEMNLSADVNLTISDSHQIVQVSNMCRVNCSWVSFITDGDATSIDFHLGQLDHAMGYQSLFSIQFMSISFTRCASPTALPDGEILGNDYREGSSIRYICHPPRDLNGTSVSTCIHDNSGGFYWDGLQRRCVIRDCTPPSPAIERIAGEGVIASPGFPGRVLTGHQECIWVIRAVVSENQIALRFTYFDFPTDQERQSSVLIYDIGDNKNVLLLNVSVSSSVQNVISQTDSVRVEYYGPDIDRPGYRGMYLEYEARITTTQSTSTRSSSTVLSSSSISASPTTSPTAKPTSKPTASPTSRGTESSTSSAKPSITASANSLTVASDQTTRSLGQTEPKKSSNPGGVVAGVLIPVVLLAFGIAFYVWYRKKYPVRMIVGKNFPKFSNPIYEKGASTLTLVREDFPINDKKE